MSGCNAMARRLTASEIIPRPLLQQGGTEIGVVDGVVRLQRDRRSIRGDRIVKSTEVLPCLAEITVRDGTFRIKRDRRTIKSTASCCHPSVRNAVPRLIWASMKSGRMAIAS